MNHLTFFLLLLISSCIAMSMDKSSSISSSSSDSETEPYIGELVPIPTSLIQPLLLQVGKPSQTAYVRYMSDKNSEHYHLYWNTHEIRIKRSWDNQYVSTYLGKDNELIPLLGIHKETYFILLRDLHNDYEQN